MFNFAWKQVKKKKEKWTKENEQWDELRFATSWCWSWNSNTLATWCEELTHLKRPWCWERLRAGGEGEDTGWDGWMASPTQWTWVWVNSGSWWWTGRPGVLWFMGSQRVGHDWATELNWSLFSPGGRGFVIQFCLLLHTFEISHEKFWFK